MNKQSPVKKTNSCSFDPEKKQDSAKYHYNFVCEKDNTSTKDISPIVQGLYKTTVNKYSYKESY
jgi:hypothetical protein